MVFLSDASVYVVWKDLYDFLQHKILKHTDGNNNI